MEPNRLCEIWDAYQAKLMLIARSVGLRVPESIIEDAVQDAFIALAKQSAEPTDVMAWLVRVCRNQILDRIRSETRRHARETEHGLARWFSEPTTPSHIDAIQLAQAIGSLPERQREIITMHVWGEMTFQTIAEVLGISSSSAHRCYHDALIELRTHFQPEDQHVSR